MLAARSPSCRQMSSVFLAVRGLYNTSMPTRKPPRAHAATKGATRAQVILQGPTRAPRYSGKSGLLDVHFGKSQLFSSSVVLAPALRSPLHKARTPHLSKDLDICWKSSIYSVGFQGVLLAYTQSKCLESVRKCRCGAHAQTIEPTKGRQRSIVFGKQH